MATPSRIVLTGGGTAGHVIPHFSLLKDYQRLGIQIYYIGGKGIESNLCSARSIPFYMIMTGKLRRYFSFQNFIDVFRVILGLMQSLFYLLRIQPDYVFSKGGFVSLPVCYAAWILRIPVFTHESDLSLGLANRWIARIAHRVYCSFEDTAIRHNKGSKSNQFEFTGPLLRPDLLEALSTKTREEASNYFAFESKRPVLLITGGSTGSVKINDVVKKSLPLLEKNYNIIHLTGEGKSLDHKSPHYRGFVYLNDKMILALSLADLVLSRAGSNTIFELKSLNKPTLLVPLEEGSRGDQLENARYFLKNGWAQILREKELNPDSLTKSLNALLLDKPTLTQDNSSSNILEKILEEWQKIAY